MGRIKKYDVTQVLGQIGRIFVAQGFEACSLDDLERGTGLLRGSLYREFGSKQKMYELSLRESIENRPQDNLTVDLIIIGFQELAANNKSINSILSTWYQEQQKAHVPVAELLGTRLIENAKISTGKVDSHE